MFDRDDVTKSSVTVAIDAASIDTALDARNADLNIPDFLNTAEFPTITIVSTSVEKTGEMTGKVTGGATMLGVTLPVTLDMIWSAESALPWDATVLRTGFSATGSLSIAGFGMTKAGEFGIGPDVMPMIDVEAVKQ